MVNVLHINYSDVLGSRFNGFYMLEGNQSKEVSFSMAVWEKKSLRCDVYELPPNSKILKRLVWFILHVLYKIGDDHLSSVIGFFLLTKTDYYKKADIIHLHIIHGDTNISFNTIYKICREKKVVWTFHDQWPISGGCIHPFECKGVSEGCPKKCQNPRYKKAIFGGCMPHWAYKVRQRVYKKSNFNIVVSTNWMKQRVLSNVSTKEKPIHVIPFGVDTKIFRNIGKNLSRKKLGIPLGNFVVMLRNTGVYTDPMKGLQYAVEGLYKSNLNRETTIVTIDQKGGLDLIESKYNILELGWQDQEGLLCVLSAVDVLVMPSLQESFGLMSVEAMSCGVPVIVAQGTALPDVVQNEVGGIVVLPRNSDEIANAISLLCNNSKYLGELSISARKRAESEFDIKDCINKHLALYKSLFDEK